MNDFFKMLNLSDKFKNHIIKIYGNAGNIWLTLLPDLIDQLSVEWRLSDLNPLDRASANLVLTGKLRNKNIILKVGPDAQALSQEARALRAFTNGAAAELVAATTDALLLTKVEPGITLIQIADEKIATTNAANLILALHNHKCDLTAFHSLDSWCDTLKKSWPIPSHHLHKASHFAQKLLESSKQKVLLHGDLHHENILQHGSSWIAIDPKGVVGDPAFEAAAYIRNPMTKLLNMGDLNITLRRVKKFLQTSPAMIITASINGRMLEQFWHGFGR